MAQIEVPIVYAFTDGVEGGNPAGVVLDAEGLSAGTRQSIAAQVNLSETAFVSASEKADFRVEFFTPTRQVADCGHATVAAYSLLQEQGRLRGAASSKETIDGVRQIALSDGRVFMEQSAPVYTVLPTGGVAAGDVLRALGLSERDLLDGHAPTVVNTGVNSLQVPLRDRETVRRALPDLPAIHAVSDRLDLVMFYVFSPETVVPGRDAGARMFAPRYGIREESATGMAAGPLGCFLHDVLGVSKTRLVIEQGRLMTPPAPSELVVELSVTGGKVDTLRVGGRAHLTHSLLVEA